MIRRVERYHYIIIFALLVVLFVSENTLLLGLNGYIGYQLLYFIKLALWIALGILIKIFPPTMFSGYVRLRETVIGLSFIFAAFHLVCFVLVGFFTSFSKSTYDLTPRGILSNVVPMAAALVGGELCRSFLVNSLSGRRPHLAVLGFGFVFALFNMSLGNITGLGDNMSVLHYVIDMVFPQIIQSAVASCLVYLAGPVPSILYLGVIRLFNYVSPYLPNPSDIPKLLFNVLFPLLSISVISRLYSREASASDRTAEKNGTFGWIVVSALSVAIVWFAVGIFPIFPSVILTGSMEPKIMPGDIVIVNKNTADEVGIGDVVMYYSEDGIYITHRIVQQIFYSGSLQYITKGDNNTNADANPVNPDQIKGRVIGVVPKIGLPALYIKANISDIKA